MWPNPLETADLVTFTEEILNGKLHFFVQWVVVNFILIEKESKCYKILYYGNQFYTNARFISVLTNNLSLENLLFLDDFQENRS